MAPRVPSASRPDLTIPRHRFLLALDDRLLSLRQVIAQVAADPAAEPGRQQLTRRLRAMGDACTTLGFEAMSAAFASAETSFDCTYDDDTTRRALSQIEQTLDLVPSLAPAPSTPPRRAPAASATTPPLPRPPAQRAATEVPTKPEPAALMRRPVKAVASLPRRIIVLGTLRLREVILRADARADGLRFEFTVDLADALELAHATGHAACLIDVRHQEAALAWQQLAALGPCQLLVAPGPDAASTMPSWASLAQPLVADDSLFSRVTQLLDSQPAAMDAATPPALPPPAPEPIPVPEVQPSHPAPSERRSNATRTASAQRNPSASVSNLAHRTILVVDADAGMSWFLLGVLRAANATVIEARDGLEAWRLAQERMPDLIVSDVELPELDGFGLCRQIKRDVILADVPVLLVSWKDDALQRARELGAGAFGYFLKEADSSTILRRCAEALQPRRNVEQRLAEGQTVQGRLHGLTPYAVLRASCDVVDNARVTFEDAGYRFIVHVGDGRLLDAARESDSGARLTGSAVLPSLLGMRAGRFVVERSGANVQCTFTSGLTRLLEPHVARTRRALRIVSGDALHHVARLELDQTALAPYHESSPAIVRKLVDKLADGVAPVALIRSVSPSLLETVLSDIALRGAIRGAFDAHGRDLLEASELFSQPFDLDVRTPTSGFLQVVAAPGAPRIDHQSTPEHAEQAAAFAESLLGPAAPTRGVASAEQIVTHEADASDAITGEADAKRPHSLAVENAEPPKPAPPPKPRLSRVPRPEALNADDAAPFAAEELAAIEALTATLADDAPQLRDSVPGEHPSELAAAPSAPLLPSSEAAPLEAPARPRIIAPGEDPDALDARWLMADPDAESPEQVLLSVHDVGDASPVVRVLAQSEPAAAGAEVAPGGAENDAATAEGDAVPASADSIDQPAAAPPTEVERLGTAEPKAEGHALEAPISDSPLDLSGVLFEQLAATPSSPRAAVAVHSKPSTETRSVVPHPPKRDADRLLLSANVSQAPSTTQADYEEDDYEEDDPLFASLHGAPSPDAPRARGSRGPRNEPKTAATFGDAGQSTTPPQARQTHDPARTLRDGADRWATAALLGARRAVAWAKDRKATAVAARDAARKEAAAPANPPEAAAADVDPADPHTADRDKPPELARAAPATLKHKFSRAAEVGKRSALPALALFGAAALAFSGVDAITARFSAAPAAQSASAPQKPASISSPASVADDLLPDEARDESPQGLGDPSLAPPSTKLVSPRLEMHTVNLPLPDGVQVPPGKGLLEINTAGSHKIYVDGAFIGKGPVRRVPLGTGAHQVLMRQDGEEDSFSVDVSEGQRVRLEPVARAAVAP